MNDNHPQNIVKPWVFNSNGVFDVKTFFNINNLNMKMFIYYKYFMKTYTPFMNSGKILIREE